jgi:hypothetical protein
MGGPEPEPIPVKRTEELTPHLLKVYERLCCAMGRELHKISKTNKNLVNKDLLYGFYLHRLSEVSTKVDLLEAELTKMTETKADFTALGKKFAEKAELEKIGSNLDELAKDSYKWSNSDASQMEMLLAKQRQNQFDSKMLKPKL